jgi:hypothetical protein
MKTQEIVHCWRCGKDIPADEAKTYWTRSRMTRGEWDSRDFCAGCAKDLSAPDWYPEQEF